MFDNTVTVAKFIKKFKIYDSKMSIKSSLKKPPYHPHSMIHHKTLSLKCNPNDVLELKVATEDSLFQDHLPNLTF